MYQGKTVFARLTSMNPYHRFQHYVDLYQGNNLIDIADPLYADEDCFSDR